MGVCVRLYTRKGAHRGKIQVEIHDNFVINPEATKMQVFCLDAYQKSPAVGCVSKEACSLSRALHSIMKAPHFVKRVCYLSS